MDWIRRLIVWLFVWLFDWSFDCLIDWLIVRLIVWLIGWLVDCLIDQRWTDDASQQAQTTMTYPCNNFVQHVHFIRHSRSRFSCNRFFIVRLLKFFWHVVWNREEKSENRVPLHSWSYLNHTEPIQTVYLACAVWHQKSSHVTGEIWENWLCL